VIGKSGIPVTQGNVFEAYVAAVANEPIVGTRVTGDTHNRFGLWANGTHLWGPGSGSTDCAMFRTGTALMGFTGGLALTEMAEPAAAGANGVRIYAKDTGGKTELCARFPTGAVQRLAIEP
jgi:hypothetical protein